MYRFYIPHELKIGDITHLADNDSQLAIRQGVKLEDIVLIDTYSATFNAVVTDTQNKSVEVEIVEKVEDRNSNSRVDGGLTVIQSISSEKKFGLFLEKAVEIGITNVIPLISEYSLEDEKEFRKNDGLWRKIISDAKDQSRNPYPTVLEKIQNINNLNVPTNCIKICLASESIETISIEKIVNGSIKGKNIAVAIGPESGWSFTDISYFKKLGFKFVKLNGNILRTETAGLVIASIIKFVRGDFNEKS